MTNSEARKRLEESTSKIRRAVVGNTVNIETVRRYLPDNYVASLAPFGGRWIEGTIIIEGEDVAGWTLDDYVIPRLASGLIGCREVSE